jgi:hypothetical protein
MVHESIGDFSLEKINETPSFSATKVAKEP